MGGRGYELGKNKDMNGVGVGGYQEPGSRGGHLSTVGRPFGPFSGPNRHGQSPGTSLSGEGFFWRQKAELGRPDLSSPPPPNPIDFDPAAPTSSSAPAGEPLPAEAPRGPGVRRGARLPAPTAPRRGSEPPPAFLRRTGAGIGWHLPASAT